MKCLVSIILLAFAMLPTAVSISSVSGSLVVVAVPAPRVVAVALTMPADFVSVPLYVISEQKNAALAYEESRQAIELITQKAKADGRFHTLRGVVSLSEHKSSFGISSGSWTQPAAAAQIYLLVPFTKEGDNIFGAGAEVARFVETLHLPGKARYDIGKLQLAVDNPEQYRAKLLGQIAQEIQKTCEAISANGRVAVEGLESSVMVRQADDRNVELFLNYSLSITMDSDQTRKK
jgi:hypothetical protein